MGEFVHIGVILGPIMAGVMRQATEVLTMLLHPDEIAHLPQDEQKRLIWQQTIELGIRPWEVCLLEVDDGPSPWPHGTSGFTSWGQAQALRRLLTKQTAGRH